MKILVIQQKKIGDVLTSTILFEALRKKYPTAELHYLVNTNTIPVLKNNPFIDHIVCFTKVIEESKQKFYDFLKKIKNRKYDIVIDVYLKNSSVFMTSFSKADTRIGYHKFYNSFIYTQTIKRLKEPEHGCSLAIENRMRLLTPLDIPFEPLRPKIYLTKQEIDFAKTTLLNSEINLKKPLIMVSVLGSSSQKSYPTSYMINLLDFCSEVNPEIQFLFNYIPKQKEEVRSIYQVTANQTKKQIFLNIFGKNLREFMALTSHCDALIGNEGGANNMAKALDIPTFTIFSPRLKKENWFGKNETPPHLAVHIADFINIHGKDKKDLKKNSQSYYEKMKPEFIKPKLKIFLDNIKKTNFTE